MSEHVLCFLLGEVNIAVSAGGLSSILSPLGPSSLCWHSVTCRGAVNIGAHLRPKKEKISPFHISL